MIQELPLGGAERVVAVLSSGARARGHQVAVAAAPGALAAEVEARIHSIPLIERKPWRLVAAAATLRSVIRHTRPDVIHCHNPGVASAVALITHRGRRPKSFVTVHGVSEQDYARAALVLRLAGLPVVAAGPGVAEALMDRGVSVHSTVVNGISPPPMPAHRQELEREWGLQAGTPLLLGVGRLVEQKNFGLALRALARMPVGALAIVGEGPLHHELERERTRLGLGDRVVFAGPRADARSLIGAADAVLMPSLWEGLPLVALEALAAGTPVVATRVRGLRELFRDGEDALLVPPGDESALAEGVQRILSEPGLADRLGSGGLRTAARYAEANMVDSYLKLYAELAA